MVSNRALKRIGNKTLNKSIRVSLEFKIHRLLITFHIVNQPICLVFDLIKTIRRGCIN